MTIKLGSFVKNASREPVINSLKTIKRRYLHQDKLIANNNQLKLDAIKAIKNHNDPGKPFQLRKNDVNTYISASSISHMLDGWGYVSQAVNSLLAGNKGAAIHLAYYAELRAVMSVLAAEGIGVFDSKHIGLIGSDDFLVFVKHKRKNETGRGRTLGTHVFAWEALEKWCNSSVKPSYDLLRIFRVNGHSFSDLLPGFHPLASQLVSSNIAKSWLKQWAFDVKKYKNDRDLRNFVSYRPQTITGFPQNFDFKGAISDTYELLKVLSPSGINTFDYLDKLLLKALFKDLYTNPKIASRGSLSELIEESFNKLGTSLDTTTKNILLSGTPIKQSHLIFSESSKNTVEALPVISRAALLLRVATGSASILLEDAGLNKSDLNFIWANYGFNNGFWVTPKPSGQFNELWSELETEFSDIITNISHLDNSSYLIRRELDEDINKLSQFNRACLWGI